MKKVLYALHLINYLVLIILFIFPYEQTHMDGGDILIIFTMGALFLLILSVIAYVFERNKSMHCVVSFIISIVSLCIVGPIIFTILFFGLPFID